MKTIPIALSPTRSRALNMFLGLVLALVSVLVLLALITYHPADPSLNTSNTGLQRYRVMCKTGLVFLAPG